jgi:elongation factor P--beta-lysine ligase
MDLKFTKNHLIRFIYKETSVAETKAIDVALNEDFELLEKYHELLQGYHQLPQVKFNPTESSIQQILRHSKRATVEPQH